MLSFSKLSAGCAPVLFGASPTIMDDAAKHAKDDAQNHAVKFFNFMIRRCFPELEEHLLAYIEPSEKRGGRTSSALRPD